MQKLLIYIVIVFICSRCAQITPLTGGKKDTVPPKVLKSVPGNASVNFTAKEIEIQFDEYITLKDLANQLVVTPQLQETPEIEASGKKLKIKFTTPLKPNTTYRLFFGNAVTDIRENNPLLNFEYVFSTGNAIDSLKLNGQVINAFDKLPADKLLVGLYNAEASDSIVYKEKPLYISRTDGSGNFKFNYLPNASFKIVAIKDQNKNFLYDGSEEQIAFSSKLVSPKDSSALTMYLFKEIPFKSFIKKLAPVEYGKAYIIYNKAQNSIKDVKANGLINYTINSLKDSLTLYYDQVYDTLNTHIEYHDKKTDTLYIKVPSKAIYTKQQASGSIKYTLSSTISSQLAFYELPKFTLNFPIEEKDIAKEKISLYEVKDTTKQIKEFSIINQSAYSTSFSIQSTFKPETGYRLIFNKAAFANSRGRINDSICYNFKTTYNDDYGQLNLKLFFPKKENYLVQLLNDKAQIIKENKIEFALTSTSEKIMKYENLIPGNYFIKIVEDVNKNGLFDSGDYFSHQQAETIFINPTPIKLLAGWEIDNEWKVN